jgi:hypothetical protein
MTPLTSSRRTELRDLRQPISHEEVLALLDSLTAAEAALSAARAQKDGAYAERNQVVALLARMALALGWRAGLRGHEPDPDPAWDDDWKNVVAIDLPTGQVTWHYHDSDRPLFSSLPPYTAPWDGHDTAEKYRRVNAAASPTPEPDDAPHGPCGFCERCIEASRMAWDGNRGLHFFDAVEKVGGCENGWGA